MERNYGNDVTLYDTTYLSIDNVACTVIAMWNY